MRARKDGPSKKSTVGLAPEFCHPLSLQGMPVDQFMKTVDLILSGKLKLLIDRARHKDNGS